jgi:hypothetical protein
MNSNENTDKAKGTTNNRAIECSLCAPFYLFSSLLLFFSQQGAHNNKHQKK